MKRGELCCFSYQNKLLIKRVIGLPGDKIYIDENNMAYPASAYIQAAYDRAGIDRPFGECLDDFKEPVPLGQLLAVLDSYVE